AAAAPAPAAPAAPAQPPAASPQAAKPPTGQAAAPAQPQKPPEPKAKIRLDEIDSIHYERSPGMTARFVGQPNLDYTMPGLSYKPEEAKKGDLPDDVFAPDPKDPKYLADQKKAEARKEEAKKVADRKAEEKKKAEEADDVNAPPPGTV